jgi:hypothetical protein
VSSWTDIGFGPKSLRGWMTLHRLPHEPEVCMSSLCTMDASGFVISMPALPLRLPFLLTITAFDYYLPAASLLLLNSLLLHNVCLSLVSNLQSRDKAEALFSNPLSPHFHRIRTAIRRFCRNSHTATSYSCFLCVVLILLQFARQFAPM